MLKSVDVTFDVIWRGSGGDRVVVSFSHHFDPPAGFDAVPFEADATGAEVPARDGDRLVLRWTAAGASSGPAFIPNADGANTNGRIPSLKLP